jgi:hypothetical protein
LQHFQPLKRLSAFASAMVMLQINWRYAFEGAVIEAVVMVVVRSLLVY